VVRRDLNLGGIGVQVDRHRIPLHRRRNREVAQQLHRKDPRLEAPILLAHERPALARDGERLARLRVLPNRQVTGSQRKRLNRLQPVRSRLRLRKANASPENQRHPQQRPRKSRRMPYTDATAIKPHKQTSEKTHAIEHPPFSTNPTNLSS
jgi:hypothetical protein